MNLGVRFKHFRKMVGLKQGEAAQLMGIKSYQLANYENNRSEPNISTLKKMSKVYKVSIDGLVGNMMPPKINEEEMAKYNIDKLLNSLNDLVEVINETKDNLK